MGALILRATIVGGQETKSDFDIEISRHNLNLFLNSIKTYSAEVKEIFRYEVYEGHFKKRKLLLRGDISINHKKALIISKDKLTTALIEYAKKSGKILFDIRPEVFEELIAEIFASNGFKVEITKRSRDGGKDIVGVKYDLGIPSHWIIECKRYRENKVDVRLVRDLFAVKEAGHFSNAVLVTTSSFTDPALDFQRSVWGLSLADFRTLTSWLDGYVFTETGGLYIAKDFKMD